MVRCRRIYSSIQQGVPRLSEYRPRQSATYGDESPGSTKAPDVRIVRKPTFEWLQDATLWERSALEEILDSLASKMPQVY